MFVFNSLMAITGKNRVKSRKGTKNNPNEPMKIPASTQVGEYMVQLDGM